MFPTVLKRHIQAVAISLEHHQACVGFVMVLGSAITTVTLVPEMVLKECLIIMFISIFDGCRC